MAFVVILHNFYFVKRLQLLNKYYFTIFLF